MLSLSLYFPCPHYVLLPSSCLPTIFFGSTRKREPHLSLHPPKFVWSYQVVFLFCLRSLAQSSLHHHQWKKHYKDHQQTSIFNIAKTFHLLQYTREKVEKRSDSKRLWLHMPVSISHFFLSQDGIVTDPIISFIYIAQVGRTGR